MRTGMRFMPAAPPRHVPMTLKATVMFGGIKNQMIWMALTITFTCFAFIGMQSDFTTFLLFSTSVETTTGSILESKDSGYSEGGSKTSHGTPIYEDRYEFTAKDGKKYEGVSFGVGKEFEKKASVEIQYKKGNPSASRITGMRRKPFSILAGVVTILLWVAFLYAAIITVRENLRAIRLLRNGKSAGATLKSSEIISTRTSKSKSDLYRMEFEFVAEDGNTYKTKIDTNEPSKLQDEETEPLLYDPLAPEKAVLTGSLPGDPDFDEQGQLKPGSAVRMIVYHILPGIAILCHVFFFLTAFFASFAG